MKTITQNQIFYGPQAVQLYKLACKYRELEILTAEKLIHHFKLHKRCLMGKELLPKLKYSREYIDIGGRRAERVVRDIIKQFKAFCNTFHNKLQKDIKYFLIFLHQLEQHMPKMTWSSGEVTYTSTDISLVISQWLWYKSSPHIVIRNFCTEPHAEIKKVEIMASTVYNSYEITITYDYSLTESIH